MPKPKLVDDMVGVESEYLRLSEEALTDLARAVHSGQVFGSWEVRERDLDLMHHIFLILSYMHDIERKKMKRDGVVHFYGYRAEALPRNFYGYPCFMKCHMLDRKDSLRLERRIREIKQEEADEKYPL